LKKKKKEGGENTDRSILRSRVSADKNKETKKKGKEKLGIVARLASLSTPSMPVSRITAENNT